MTSFHFGKFFLNLFFSSSTRGKRGAIFSTVVSPPDLKFKHVTEFSSLSADDASTNSNSPLSRASLFFAVVLDIAVAERRRMETLKEDEEYNWREVDLPSLIPKVAEPELERETGERRRGRDVLVAIDHGPNSKHAFDWALVHFCRLADTIHLIHAVSDVNNEVVYQTTQALMEKLGVEALQVSMVTRTVARIVEGEPGKAICREADRLRPAAIIMGTRGRGLIQSVLQGSVGEYCFHNCKAAPIIVVPGKESGERSVL